MNEQEALLHFLESYLTERRRELFLKIVAERTRHVTVALENIYQPHNASAVVRSCECFGIQNLHIIEKDHSFKANTGIVMGSNKWIDMFRYKSSVDCIKALKEQGYRIIATTPHKNDLTLEDLILSQKSAFFFGEESIGLSNEVIDNADEFLKIPMYGFTESLNISVTVAIALNYITTKLRKSESIPWQLSEQEMLEKRIDWAVKTITKGDELVKYFNAKKNC